MPECSMPDIEFLCLPALPAYKSKELQHYIDEYIPAPKVKSIIYRNVSQEIYLMIDDLDPEALRKTRRIGYYFLGYYTAKPLYGRLTPDGRVDKSAGFNGDMAVLFVPLNARKTDDVTLFIARTAPGNIQLPTGKRNWKKINEIAEKYLKNIWKKNEPPIPEPATAPLSISLQPVPVHKTKEKPA